jgi:nucleotide-binding universal stress UspA family protein
MDDPNAILVGVDDSKHSEDAIAFAHRLAQYSSGPVVVACAFPSEHGLPDIRDPQLRPAQQRDAEHTAQRMSLLLEEINGRRIRTRALARPSRVHALHELAIHEQAAIIVVGTSRAGQLGQVVPHGTGARLLHGAPCAVAVAPDGYRARREPPMPIRRMGVAYDGSRESRAAFAGAVAAVRALDAELEIITVVSAQVLATTAMMGGPGYIAVDEDRRRQAREDLDALVAGLPCDVAADGTILNGPRAHQLIRHSKHLDLLFIGSRGYGPVHGMLAGAVSARVLRDAVCPVIAMPRGVEARLHTLLEAAG